MIPVQDILRRVSTVLNDDQYVRWEVPELLDWINDAGAEIVIRRPAARAERRVLKLAAGAYHDIPDDARTLLDVRRNMGFDGQTPGMPVQRCERHLIDDTTPNWYTSKQSESVRHFMYDERAPKEFFTWPPAVAGIHIDTLLSVVPPTVGESDSVDLDREYMGPIVSYTLYRALAKDSEYANGQLAAAHFNAFNEALGANSAMTTATSPNEANP